MPINKAYFFACIVIAAFLCAAQIIGSTILILACLAIFLALVGWSCAQNFTLPILLFFLPWSPLLRTNPTSFSFYTFGMVLVCAVSVFKNWSRFKRYHITVGILLLSLSLFSKLLDGSSLAFDYIAFMMLIFLFPVVKEEFHVGNYDMYQAVSFFSAGIIIAALCAQQYTEYPNISKYISVASYLTVVRLSGFYGDPNFYTAQITAALGGCFVLILRATTKKRMAFVGILLALLLYCGFLSGSKSFVLVSAVLILLWLVELLRMRGRTGMKITLIIVSILAAVYIASSALFSGLIDVLVTRFSNSKDLSGFTTGRTELWQSYLEELITNAKVLFLGKGFTNIKINGRASHNTIIQAVFQFGLIGAPILLAWTVCFFRDVAGMSGLRKRQIINVLILLVGSFMPWLAIDALFFDEYFLLQWYVFLGIQQLSFDEDPGALPNQHAAGQTDVPGKHRLRIVWR